MSSSRPSNPGNRSILPSILFLLIVFSAKIHYTKPMEVFFTMSILFLEYPPCSTCQKAKRWLDEHNVSYTSRHIKENNPTAEELTELYKKSGLPLKKFFNTSGLIYKSMGLKDKLPTMNEEEQIALLATDGMLVKRPLVIGDSFVLTGFKEKDWQEKLG